MNRYKIFLLVLFSSQLFLVASCRAAENKSGDSVVSEKKSLDKTHYHIIGDSRGAAEFEKALNDPDPAWDLIHQGARHSRGGEYELAILSLKRSLDMPGGDKWTARGLLGKAYEAKGDYSHALEQVNWQIAQHPKDEVPSGLLTRKQNLEKFLSTQT